MFWAETPARHQGTCTVIVIIIVAVATRMN